MEPCGSAGDVMKAFRRRVGLLYWNVLWSIKKLIETEKNCFLLFSHLLSDKADLRPVYLKNKYNITLGEVRER